MTTQPKKKKDAEEPKEIPPIRRCLNKFGISLQQLADCMAPEVQFDSRSTLHRMVHGTISEELGAELRPVAARCLKRFLIGRGLNKSEIDAELTHIFSKGEYQPMSFQRLKLRASELTFFNLPRDPFFDDPESKDEVYMPPEYREIFDTIIDAAKYRHFLAVLGPVGSSKSTIQNYIRDHITRDTTLKIVWPEFYNQAQLTPMEIGRSILQALGVTQVPNRATKLAAAVTDQLRTLTQDGYRVAIVIDNCHELQKPAVRSLKKFIEMSSGGFQKYLGIILMGWPEFETTLRLPDFTEIYERLDVVAMPPFIRNPIGEWQVDPALSARLAAGYLAKRFENIDRDVTDYYDEEAVRYIAANANTPLQCGNIANKALRISMEKWENKKVIGDAIRKEMFFDTPTAQPGYSKRK